MKKIVLSHIGAWLLIFWAIFLGVTMVTFLVLYCEITSAVNTMASVQMANEHSTTSGTAAVPLRTDQWLTTIKIRIMLLLSGAVFVIGGLGFLWMRIVSRRLARPVKILSKALLRLSSGNLNETVTLDTTDEFSQIATGINELAANLQELLLYIWKQTGQCLERIESLQNSTDAARQPQLPPESMEQIKQLNRAVRDLREMARAYVFYDVCLDGDKTLAATEPNPSPANKTRKHHTA
jgi:methyl-accepting chemotaxis protein